jgi:hypothetical protein
MVRVLLVTLLVVGLAAVGFAQTATSKAVRAQRARQAIKLQLSTDRKTIMATVDDKSNYAPLKKEQSFTTTAPVDVTIDRLNPMTMLVSADVADADDPTNATVGKLVEALLQATATLRPDLANEIDKLRLSTDFKAAFGDRVNAARAGQPAITCDESASVDRLIQDLEKDLFNPVWSAVRIQLAVKSWVAAIDAKHRALTSGPEAVQAAITLIDGYLKNETDSLEAIFKRATTTVEKAETVVSTTGPAECQREANTWYRMIRLTNPRARLAAIKTVFGSLTDLRKTLDAVYANPTNWFGDRKIEFIVRRAVEPTNEQMQVVTVKAVGLDYGSLDNVTPAVLAKREDLVSGSFIVRQYSFFVPEIGGGATFARYTRPKFGTTLVDGKSVVAAVREEDVSVDPTVMVNFVCRGCPASLLTPMLQVGVSTSKEAPTLFFGGGIRLFHTGKGDFAIGFGRAFPWVKQLKTLKEGEPAGTKDIEADLEFRRLVGQRPTYIALQYKF